MSLKRQICKLLRDKFLMLLILDETPRELESLRQPRRKPEEDFQILICDEETPTLAENKSFSCNKTVWNT